MVLSRARSSIAVRAPLSGVNSLCRKSWAVKGGNFVPSNLGSRLSKRVMAGSTSAGGSISSVVSPASGTGVDSMCGRRAMMFIALIWLIRSCISAISSSRFLEVPGVALGSNSWRALSSVSSCVRRARMRMPGLVSSVFRLCCGTVAQDAYFYQKNSRA
ncbi:hypothetical protein ARMGADRAFT_224960 [Armillaria gallica]|uniref:Uncharacterized protein n=1 Tax=Armillaria gallica TaxID=47427 RepID=A0A2H3E6B2_ARMGA|nr:hypothetical protein ARMGADRAFT_224960 [Armillaria gallica]